MDSAPGVGCAASSPQHVASTQLQQSSEVVAVRAVGLDSRGALRAGELKQFEEALLARTSLRLELRARSIRASYLGEVAGAAELGEWVSCSFRSGVALAASGGDAVGSGTRLSWSSPPPSGSGAFAESAAPSIALGQRDEPFTAIPVYEIATSPVTRV